MAIRIQADAEPITGYKLIARIGGGGFGEVWKAEAPGGLLKAIKFVYGDLTAATAEDARRAEQELKALKRVQTVRHPYLLSLERYDIVDGRLLIVMELADCNLWDRFRECRAAGLPGIPREDLLRYLQEAAEVLDLMNNQHQLQHLDIKPQNLFLIHEHVKVADFGLVKDLENMLATVTGGVTPVYAAPETFDGVITRYCDQYSLAIVYQELLTGQRPFNGTTMQQLVMQHLRATPNLSAVPAADRAVLLRALAKNPEERFPSCLAMIRALQNGLPGSGPPPAVETPTGCRTVGSGSNALTRMPQGPLPVPFPPQHTPATEFRTRREDTPGLLAPLPPMLAPPEMTGPGPLLPALVIGLGQTGLVVLQRLRRLLGEQFGSLAKLPSLQLLHIDTDPETVAAAVSHDAPAPLAADEVLLARLNRPGPYLKPRRNGRSLIEGWFDPQLLYRIPRNPQTLGLRSLGRLAFCDHYQPIAQRLRLQIEACTHPDSLAQTERQTRLQLRTNRPRVYIVTGLAGGTGSGMFIDLAYTVRHRLRRLGYNPPQVVGIFLLPAVERNPARMQGLSNTYAALTELNHYSTPGIGYTASFDDRDALVQEDQPPFQRFVLLSQGGPTDAARSVSEVPDAAGRAAQLLSRELFSPLGRTADERRVRVPAESAERGGVCGQTFGFYAISWPRGQLLHLAARQLCRRLIERWTAGDATAVKPAVGEWVREQWAGQQLGPEHLIERLQQACEKVIDQAPEALFAQLAEPFRPRGRFRRTEVDRSALKQTMIRLEQVVGTPGESEVGRVVGQFNEALRPLTERLAKEYAGRLGQLAVCLVEQPDFRLAGAEEAIRQLRTLLDQAVAHYEPLARELADKSAEAYSELHTLLDRERTRRPNAAQVVEALTLYPKWRYQSLVVRQLLAVYTDLRSQLADALREVEFCRQRLDELFAALDRPEEPTPPAGGQLLPPGCYTLEQAIRQLLEGVTLEDVRALDRRLQGAVEDQLTALVHVCMMATNLTVKLEGLMLQQAQDFLAQRLGELDVVGMFFERYPPPQLAGQAVHQAYEAAAPEFSWPAGRGTGEVDLLGVPPGPVGEPFQRLVRHVLPQVEFTVTAAREELLIYRERPRFPLADLPHLGPLAEEAYRLALAQPASPPHCRSDIEKWLPLDPG